MTLQIGWSSNMINKKGTSQAYQLTSEGLRNIHNRNIRQLVESAHIQSLNIRTVPDDGDQPIIRYTITPPEVQILQALRCNRLDALTGDVLKSS